MAAAGRPAGGAERLARAAIRLWALAGGLVLLAVVLVNAVSILGSALLSLRGAVPAFAWLPDWLARPFPGDYELTEMGTAVAAFAFLPWCQLTGGNVTADIFTARASPRWVARFGLAAALVALLFAGLLLWRMAAGLGDRMRFGDTTTILQVPLWWAYLPCLVSLALLAVAAAMSLRDAARAA